MSSRHRFTPASFVCPECGKQCKSTGGLKRHRDTHVSLLKPNQIFQPASPHNAGLDDPPLDPGHNMSPPHSPGPEPPRSPSPQPIIPPLQRGTSIEHHPILDGTPCDADGNGLPPGASPPPWEERAPDDYSPFGSRAEFEFAEFLYVREEMSAKGWTVSHNHNDLYAMIDAIQQGDIPWESFSVKYTGPIFEKQLANPDFEDEMDWAPKHIFKNGKRQFVDLFSGNWVWEQADKIAADPECHGAMFVPGVLGSDKTTVSVGTGNTEFYPFYGGVGNVHNGARQAHREALSVMAFLSIPKTTRQFAKSKEFRKFRRQLFHSSIARILQPLKPYMTKPRITRCADGHFRRTIYGLGPDIADYPEQALLTCVVQGYCPRCLSPSHDLDRLSARRCVEHTDALLEGCTLKELWDDFGIVGDIILSMIFAALHRRLPARRYP
ncbi:hypothetical protein B0H10DRAFT_2357643 [Mycena sp. CBHHK59/15]|nr:hypothetical protein B0H10DRAFT_2357643 [Mycena sp. CBHHK59/15]